MVDPKSSMAHRSYNRSDDLTPRDGLRRPYKSLVDGTTSTLLVVVLIVIFTLHRC